jgi:hypothetical protein
MVMKTVPECRFIKPNGLRCQAAAMRGSPFCYHARTRVSPRRPRRNKEAVLNLPSLDSQTATLPLLNEVIDAIASNSISTKRASSLLYALQIARSNT